MQVEKTRHVLLLREKLLEQHKTSELSKLDKEIQNTQAKARSAYFNTSPNNAAVNDENPKDIDVKEKVRGANVVLFVSFLKLSMGVSDQLLVRLTK